MLPIAPDGPQLPLLHGNPSVSDDDNLPAVSIDRMIGNVMELGLRDLLQYTRFRFVVPA